MSLADLFHSVATGPERRRMALTPVGLAVGLGWLLLPVFGGLYTDAALGLPRLAPWGPGVTVGFPLLAAGLALHAWCVALFARARGTATPFNPPRQLVRTGPYAWTRNPMLMGVFSELWGIGFLLGSASMLLLWTPLFIVANVIELKLVEEPELERRLGAGYREYKRRVPMFIPRRGNYPGKDAPLGTP